MGRRGPPAKPTKLKIAAGNPGKRPLNDNEPAPREGAPPRPAWLTGEALEEWERIIPELEEMHVLAVVDRAALAGYCQAWEELVVCTRVLQEEGRIVEEPIVGGRLVKGHVVHEIVGHKKKKHPGVQMQRDAFARLRAFLGEFGLSPASRTRVKVKAGEKEVDPLEELLRGRKKA